MYQRLAPHETKGLAPGLSESVHRVLLCMFAMSVLGMACFLPLVAVHPRQSRFWGDQKYLYEKFDLFDWVFYYWQWLFTCFVFITISRVQHKQTDIIFDA